MKMLVRAAVAACLALSFAAPSIAQTLYTVQVWDPRFPGSAGVRITTTLNAAAALVQAGVATPVNPGLYGLLENTSLGGSAQPVAGALDFSNAANSAFIL